MKPQDKVFRAFFESKERKLYYNQIKEHTKLSHSSLQNTLKKMEEQSILSTEKTKAHNFYKIKDKKLATLKFSEIAHEKFNKLSLNVKAPLKEFLKEIPQTIFTVVLFGSAANKEEREDSDIDLVIVHEGVEDFEKVKKKVNAISNHPLSIFISSTRQFIEAKDHIIIQARKKGFPIYKEQNFYEAQLQ